jgi:hypothetical protein
MTMTEFLLPPEVGSRGGDSFVGGMGGSEAGDTTVDLLIYW